MIVISQNNSKKTALLVWLSGVLVLLLVIAGYWGYNQYLADDGLILSNVYAAGVNIGGKTPEEAKVLVERQTDLTYPYEDMVIRFPDQDLHLKPADTGVTLDIDKLIKDAYNYGRTGSRSEREVIREMAATSDYTLNLGDYLVMDTDYIQSQIDGYVAAHTSEFAASAFEVTGERPALDADNFKADYPCQTLVIHTGNPGRQIDLTGLLEQVTAAYAANTFLVTVDTVPTEELPEAIDLEAIYAEHAAAAVDATFTKGSNGSITVTKESYGYDFDLEAAAALIAETPYGETISIPYRYVEPKWTADELGDGLFLDVLGSYKTVHTSDSNRNTNLKLACKAINGVVLMPGEQFDYNKTLGQRTAEKGYKAAGAYVNGVTVDDIGGGICQVSSTLYYCTLFADLQIDTRRAHSYVSSYMPLGMDAAVSWGGPDFRFTNNTQRPIKIEAWVADGYVHVKILGTDTKGYTVKMEYEVLSETKHQTEYKVMTAAEAKAAGYTDGKVLQTPYDGCTVKSYKCKYDAKGNLISRTFEADSYYKVRNKIIVKVEG